MWDMWAEAMVVLSELPAGWGCQMVPEWLER